VRNEENCNRNGKATARTEAVSSASLRNDKQVRQLQPQGDSNSTARAGREAKRAESFLSALLIFGR
jgi:hypothetical protein